MPVAHLRFYSELNDFLPIDKKFVSFPQPFNWHCSIKHIIEALGVPHTEVDLILINGQSVDFTARPNDGDHISIYPVFETLDITPVIHLRPAPLRNPSFILDTHLGKLAAYLRMTGFDTLYKNDFTDEQIALIAAQDGRIVLTRDRGLLKRNLVTRGYIVRQNLPRYQVCEVIERFDLYQLLRPFQRCLRCNGLLVRVEKEAILEHLLPDTARYFNEFYQCQECCQIYWKGSHYQKMQVFVQDIIGQNMADALK